MCLKQNFLTDSISPILSHVFNNRFDNAKKIVISSNDILNINNKNGMKESVVVEPKLYSNFVFNNLTIENKRQAQQAITEIELYDIEKQDYAISDVQYDGGFFEEKQKIVLLAYNNGNTKDFIDVCSLNYYTYESGAYRKHFVKKQEINYEEIEPGNVKSLIIESLESFYDFFEDNREYSDLKIVVQNREGEEIEFLSVLVRYDREQQRFVNHPRGSAGHSVEEVPLFNLTTDVNKQSVKCSQMVSYGATNIGFTILVDRTCRLKYKIKIKSGKKEIKDKNSYTLLIRVPAYTQEHGGFFGDFYNFLLAYNQELKSFDYTKDLIYALKSELVFDKYKAAREFGKITI